jgi:tetratricopeptide (TPR) repeat protein
MGIPYSWTILWPGLARLWLRGQWGGLATALLFTGMVNGLLVTTFLWPRVIGTAHTALVFNIVGWFTVLCFWGASVWTTWTLLPRWQPGADARGDDSLFLRAQTEYLKGHWYEAEKLLEQMLQASPRDADAHLMLSTLYRHTRRYDEARRGLEVLERLAGGAKWLFEIHEERRRLAHAETSGRGSDARKAPDDAGESFDKTSASKTEIENVRAA